MVIFQSQNDQNNFELGTSPTSIIVLKSQEGNSVPADLIIDSDEQITDVTLEVIHSNTGDVLVEEREMELVTDDTTADEAFGPEDFEDQEFAYYSTFNIPEDEEEGDYYLIHRATVGGEDYKRTAIINVVDVYEKYV